MDKITSRRIKELKDTITNLQREIEALEYEKRELEEWLEHATLEWEKAEQAMLDMKMEQIKENRG